MPKFATVRDLKNQTTALIREAETGKACGGHSPRQAGGHT